MSLQTQYCYYNKSMKKNVLINLRVEQDLKERFQEIAESNGYTMSDLLTASMKEIVRKGTIPIYLSSKLPKKDHKILSIQDIKIAVCNILVTKTYKNGINSISIFGSYATGEMTPQSDIDLLIDINPDMPIGLFDLADFKGSVEKNLGKSVDIASNSSLMDRDFMSIVRREKIVIYEKQ